MMNRLSFMIGTLLAAVGIRAAIQAPPFIGPTWGITVGDLAKYLTTLDQNMRVLGQNDTETWGLTRNDLVPVTFDGEPFNGALVLIPGNKIGRTHPGNPKNPSGAA